MTHTTPPVCLKLSFYHFVKTIFMEKLQEDLLSEGIINSGVEKRTIYI